MYILSNIINVWFINLMRTFFYSIDKIIYNFIPTLYGYLIDIARTSVLTQADLATVSRRIYQLLTIFMVFKVIFSLIMYVVNPDDFSDKSKGLSKLGTNIIISLSILILTPYIFSYAFQLQTIILEDDSLGTLVFGNVENDKDSKSIFNSAGDTIAYNTLAPFFIPNTSVRELRDCAVIVKNGEFNKNCSGLDFDKDEIYTEKEDSLAGLAKKGKTEEENPYNANYTITDVANYVYGVETKNLGLMFRQGMVLATAENLGGTNDKDYIFDYKFIFSTAVGVVVILLLLSFCMDVALRSIKLSFLQLIAPIPILSYIDPKSGKDGLFKKWYQMCFKTYASLFVRLIALYFGVFIISKIDSISDVVNGSYQSSLFVKIFVIIGVLMFIKQLPKMLEGLGIKLDGDGKFTLNPLKKFGEEAIGGKKILGLGAAAGAGVAAGTTNFASRIFHRNSWRDEKGRRSIAKGLKNIAMAPGSAIAGVGSALWRGGKKAMKDEKMGKIFGDSYGEAMFAKLQREDLSRQGSTFGGRLRADFNRRTGNLDAAQNQEMWAAQVENVHTAAMNNFKEEKESIQRKKNELIKRKRNELEYHNKRKTGYEGMQSTVDKFVNKGKKFKTEVDVWDKTLGKYVPKAKEYEYNVKDAIDQKQKLIDNGNYTVKIGQKIAERDAKGRAVYDAAGNIKTKTATAEDVANGVKTDEAIAVEEQIKRQQAAAIEYLMSEEGQKTESGKRFKYYHDTVTGTLGNGEKVAETYDSIKSEIIDTNDKIKTIELKYSDEEEEYKQEEVNIAAKEASETERYINEVQELGLNKDSQEWKKNEADHKARKISSGQKQPEGFSPKADNAYTVRNTGMMLGNGPDIGMPPGHGEDH